MSVQLLAIKFNHDQSSASVDAYNIRKNSIQAVLYPEWQRGVCHNPEDSRAAYAIKETEGNTLTIQARFIRTDPEIQTLEVRAIEKPDPTQHVPNGCREIIRQIINAFVRALTGNVLGNVKARQITFPPSGETGFETFELENVKLWGSGVGLRTTTWDWQYRLSSSGSWTTFDTSQHRIYVTLEVPKLPWAQSGLPSQQPWTDVLDYACRWALLAQTREDAAGRITQAIYDLGPAIVEYDCPSGGSSHYSAGSFNCTAFLERLGGGIGNGLYVNCSDCATFTSTFANILGCDLWQSKMGWGFVLNPLLAIGSSVCQTACGWGGFSYHEVAWTGGATAEDNVYDACLQVDCTTTPALPVNMRFGNPGDGNYRDKLSPSGNCDPLPATRTHRSVN